MSIEPGAWEASPGASRRARLLCCRCVIQACSSGRMSVYHRYIREQTTDMCSDALVNISISDVGLSGETRQKAHTLIFFGTGTGQKSRALCPVPLAPQRLGLGSQSSVSWL